VKARVIPIRLNDEGLEQIAAAARLLAQGALVAFPTETVYGIACNAADPAAVEHLRDVKRRPSEKAFTLHLGRQEDVARYVDPVPPKAAKLMTRYWPGPLTLVLPGKDGADVGLRMPSNPIAIELLQRATVPVIAPSANRSGEPPATSAAQVAATLGDDLDIILDGGPTATDLPSTVVRVAGDTWEVLRPGAITIDMLRRTLAVTLVFVCTANQCRSPMAEVLCKHLLAEHLGWPVDELAARGFVVLSAGVYAAFDLPASRGALRAMRERGLDLSAHRSQPLTPSLLDDASVVFVMTRHHAECIADLFPEANAKVRLLDPSGADIPDPVGGSEETFRECAADLERHLREVIAAL
jgi:tRNA threonylcarbamoyl adenosine modification protein (Sua5/YciO/YrdC/YwlC family)